jgi:predicted O-methyltransferase YrrM
MGSGFFVVKAHMNFTTVESYVGRTPFITKQNARLLYEMILNQKLTSILELGIGHGTATCYMAAALHELGTGLITGVDLLNPIPRFDPSAEEQLRLTDLSRFARIVRMETGYTWFLHDEIARHTIDHRCREVYDLCLIDGPKNWTIDGAAFFLVDKLLKTNGWIIFDDYNWTYAGVDHQRDTTDGITHRQLSQSERETPQIREVFELLVQQHPNYANLIVHTDGGWALAQKIASDRKTYTIRCEESYKDVVGKMYSKARGFLHRGPR